MMFQETLRSDPRVDSGGSSLVAWSAPTAEVSMRETWSGACSGVGPRSASEATVCCP